MVVFIRFHTICTSIRWFVERTMTEDPLTDIGESSKRIRNGVYLVAVIFAAFAAFGLFAALWLTYIWPRSRDALLTEIVHNHFRAVVGIPMAALASFVVVWALTVTQGSIEFDAWGIKFKGAAGPVVFWIFVFLAISTAINASW